MAETSMGASKKLKRRLIALKKDFNLVKRASYEDVVWKLIKHFEGKKK